MKILHYSLGLPPFRTGGMTNYCIDLANEQVGRGNDVSILWPGNIINFKSNKIKFKYNNIYKLPKGNCRSISIINPLPVPLLNGIKNNIFFSLSKDKEAILNFLKSEKFDIIHVHTLMGLPIEFLETAKELNIKLIYTTHDYFGICFKCSLMQGDNICKNNNDCCMCVECNQTALSLRKIQILQSSFYRKVKNFSIIKKIRKNTIKNLNITYSSLVINKSVDDTEIKKYQDLRKYYKKCFELFDTIICNSSNTNKIFREFLPNIKSYRVLTISNSNIKDNCKILKEPKKEINIGYLGPISIRKGFFDLVEVLDILTKDNIDNFKLHIYSKVSIHKKYIITHLPYNINNIEKVMNTIDLLIVPSKWYETFGFTVLEGLSYGIPVIVSQNVGAKDLIKQNRNGYIFYDGKDGLYKILKEILKNTEKIYNLNKNIFYNQKVKTIEEHVDELGMIYGEKENL